MSSLNNPLSCRIFTPLVLENVKLSGQTGLSIGYATVTGQNVKVKAAQGEGIIKLAGGSVTMK